MLEPRQILNRCRKIMTLNIESLIQTATALIFLYMAGVLCSY